MCYNLSNSRNTVQGNYFEKNIFDKGGSIFNSSKNRVPRGQVEGSRVDNTYGVHRKLLALIPDPLGPFKVFPTPQVNLELHRITSKLFTPVKVIKVTPVEVISTSQKKYIK